MLVAMASGSMAFTPKEELTSSSFLRDSRIILIPISASSTKMIQWSTLVINRSKAEPSR